MGADEESPAIFLADYKPFEYTLSEARAHGCAPRASCMHAVLPAPRARADLRR
jgi:hypothetical protein